MNVLFSFPTPTFPSPCRTPSGVFTYSCSCALTAEAGVSPLLLLDCNVGIEEKLLGREGGPESRGGRG